MAQTTSQFPVSRPISRATRAAWLDGSSSLLDECQRQVFRGSGPGGQKRNKTSSGVRLIHTPSGCTSIATERRSQKQNLTQALARLRLEIATEIRCEPADIQFLAVGASHPMFPACVADLFDFMLRASWSVRDCANACGTSTGQITRLICADPRVLAKVNQRRQSMGMRGLRDRI